MIAGSVQSSRQRWSTAHFINFGYEKDVRGRSAFLMAILTLCHVSTKLTFPEVHFRLLVTEMRFPFLILQWSASKLASESIHAS